MQRNKGLPFRAFSCSSFFANFTSPIMKKGVIYMTNLKQDEIGKSLIMLVNVRYLIDDGYHHKELCELVKVSNTLFNELNDTNKIKFQNWLDKKMKEE